jgi:hypothetical protein
MSIAPPDGTGGNAGTLERRQLIELLASMTDGEIGLIRPATPCTSYHRLPMCALGYRRHAFSIANGGPRIATTLPRRPGDAGLTIIVDKGQEGAARKDPGVWRVFRVRRRKVETALRLLVTHSKYYRQLYGGPNGIDRAALDSLYDDGIPAEITI